MLRLEASNNSRQCFNPLDSQENRAIWCHNTLLLYLQAFDEKFSYFEQRQYKKDKSNDVCIDARVHHSGLWTWSFCIVLALICDLYSFGVSVLRWIERSSLNLCMHLTLMWHVHAFMVDFYGGYLPLRLLAHALFVWINQCFCTVQKPVLAFIFDIFRSRIHFRWERIYERGSILGVHTSQKGDISFRARRGMKT